MHPVHFPLLSGDGEAQRKKDRKQSVILPHPRLVDGRLAQSAILRIMFSQWLSKHLNVTRSPLESGRVVATPQSSVMKGGLISVGLGEILA
jgi:hypothetical protein